MNQDIKKKWVEALRSGEYKQGKHVLRKPDNTYCCLGVLCDLHSKETGTPWKMYTLDYNYMDEVGGLPDKVAEWADITMPPYDPGNIKIHVPRLDPGRATLIGLNDNGFSFTEIADVIEEQL